MRYLTKMVNRHWGAWPVHGVRPGSREAPTKNKTLAVFSRWPPRGASFLRVCRTYARGFSRSSSSSSVSLSIIDNSSVQK